MENYSYYNRIIKDRLFDIVHIKDPYFKSLDFHSHDYYEIYFFIDGNVTYHIEENIYELIPGDVLIIPPGEMHRPNIINTKFSYERIVFSVRVDCINECFNENVQFANELIKKFQSKEHLIHFSTHDFEKCIELSNTIIEIQKSFEVADNLLIKPYLTILLIHLYNKCINAENTTNETKPENIISHIILYINENLNQDLNLDLLSNLFFVSKFHLIRKFKEYTNTTVGQYITSKRIIYAKALMQQGFSAIDASQQSGFNNYSNFYKAFIKETGLSPKKYISK